MNFRNSEQKFNHLCLSFLVNYLDKKYKSVVSFNFSYNFNAVKNSIATMDGLTCCSSTYRGGRGGHQMAQNGRFFTTSTNFHLLLMVQWITAINTITIFVIGL